MLLVSACVPQPADCSREDIFCVGLVTAYDGIEDHGLNQAAWETLQNIETQARVARLDKIESIDARDWQKNIIFFAENGYDAIVTVGVNLSEATVAVAAEYPHIQFIGVDQKLEESYANIATIYFAEEQSGFLAGVLATLVTESGRVGAVCETSGIDAVWRYCEGFRQGVTYGNEEVRAYMDYRDDGSRDKTFNDPEWGEQSVLSLIDDGVDIVTAFGGDTAIGAFLAASKNGILVIANEGDQYFRLPELRPVLVTSVIEDPRVELSRLVLMASRGEISTGPHAGQIGLAPFRAPQFESATEIKSKIEGVLQEIRNSEIKINLPERK
ncbi:MAG: BMP family ABC transporter substrate-binding protein [Anaerolineales bacterium]|nr:BMP family ABC transporter substrate-binding protein [Anaerolineales bacterium]